MQSKVGASNFINYSKYTDKHVDNEVSKHTNKEIKFMIRQTDEVDNLIKKKKESLETAAKEAIVDFDVVFYQFKIIEQNMFCC